MSNETTPKPTFTGEVMLAGWSETHNGGAKLAFWLPDSSELDVFRGLTVKKGNTAGQRFMCVLVEINDDETPVSQDAQTEKPEADKPKGGSLSKSAAIICNEPLFHEWLKDSGTINEWDDEGAYAEIAANHVRAVCGVKSRAHLDNDRMAAAKFRWMMKAYEEWVNCHG